MAITDTALNPTIKYVVNSLFVAIGINLSTIAPPLAKMNSVKGKSADWTKMSSSCVFVFLAILFITVKKVFLTKY